MGTPWMYITGALVAGFIGLVAIVLPISAVIVVIIKVAVSLGH